MATVNIDLPPILNTADPASMQIMTKYLYRLAEQLNTTLNSLDEQNLGESYTKKLEPLFNVSDSAQKLAKLLEEKELAMSSDVQQQYKTLRNAFISQVESVIASFQSQIDVLDNSIRTYVAEHYIASDPDMTLDEKISSMIQQTADQIRLEFETLASIDVAGVNDLTLNFKTYIRFNENGIEIGKVGDGASPIVARITNERLDFALAGTDVVVAYISNDKLHISMAEIDKLSIGNEAVGYVDFDMTADGLFIRWRSD